MNRILITGANRGIGLEMTRQSLADGHTVFAGCRRPAEADALLALNDTYAAHLNIIELDVASDDSVAAAKTAVSAQTNTLDLIINNAGINPGNQTVDSFETAVFQDALNVNTVGPMRVATQFIDLLRQSSNPKLVNISSQLGSLQKMRANWGNYSYNASKVALNMLSRMLAFNLKGDNIIVITMHPGWVQTDMGGSSAAVTVPDSARGILRVAANLTPADSGKFYIYNGDEHPW